MISLNLSFQEIFHFVGKNLKKRFLSITLNSLGVLTSLMRNSLMMLVFLLLVFHLVTLILPSSQRKLTSTVPISWKM